MSELSDYIESLVNGNNDTGDFPKFESSWEELYDFGKSRIRDMVLLKHKIIEKDAELARLREQVEGLKLQLRGLLEFYNQNDDEDSACYWVDKNYSLVSENDEKREWFLTAKQIQARRAQIELEAK